MLDNENPFASEDITPAFNDEWVAKRRVADALKQLTEVLVTSSPDVEQMHSIAERLEETAASFRESPRLYGRSSWAASGEHGNYAQISHELNPLAGWSNPIAPPLNSWIDGDRAYGTCQCDWAYEGPPGSVHGGIIAAIFDQFLGMAQRMGGQPGMTGYLHVNYHNRTPLNTELKLEGMLDKVEGRKTLLRGEMYADGVMTASCEGLFIRPKNGVQAIELLDALDRQ
ncbi:MAG: PaaI family thioesterase [Oceanicoccus sp.]